MHNGQRNGQRNGQSIGQCIGHVQHTHLVTYSVLKGISREGKDSRIWSQEACMTIVGITQSIVSLEPLVRLCEGSKQVRHCTQRAKCRCICCYCAQAGQQCASNT